MNMNTATLQLNRPRRSSQLDGMTVRYMAGPIVLLANLSRRLPRWISGLTSSPDSLMTAYGLLFSSSSTGAGLAGAFTCPATAYPSWVGAAAGSSSGRARAGKTASHLGQRIFLPGAMASARRRTASHSGHWYFGIGRPSDVPAQSLPVTVPPAAGFCQTPIVAG